MRTNSLLASTGYKRDKKSGKYIDPITDRKVTLETAKDRASKFYGYKNFKDAKEAFASNAYSRIVQGGYSTRRVNPKDTKTPYFEAKLIPKGKPKNRLESFAKQNGIPVDYRLQKLFAAAWKARHKESSKELADLLKYVGKVNKYRAVYASAL